MAETRETISAGGIVLNPKGEVLLVEQRGKVWSFPKGHVEEGETHLETAQREIVEETGIRELEFVREVGRYRRPKIGLKGDDMTEIKTLVLFLFRTKETRLKWEDPNIFDARWVPKSKVAGMLYHSKDKEFFLTLVDSL
ncbi:MAG TPA: NUDIX domain-containing protein [Verrucomicrobiae bacterium]|jgi:8-oxo-dGTP pyrophosphatase MutT (NUDIX family)|nr:NUDIX domain-containing protein [Verrucomicrobiae bacterium]